MGTHVTFVRASIFCRSIVLWNAPFRTGPKTLSAPVPFHLRIPWTQSGYGRGAGCRLLRETEAMTDADQRAAFDYGEEPEGPLPCAFCGASTGRIQHVDIAWPGGRHVEVWLHPECEKDFVEKAEREQGL